MKNYLFLVLLFVIAIQGYAQEYKTHKIQDGETIETIAKQYLVTPFDIYALNPDAKTSFNTNTVLIIPSSKVKNAPLPEETKEITGYKRHRVRRKETLYNISKKYNITVDDIKKANRHLYSENLRKGERIQIPQFKTIKHQVSYANTVKKYTVQPKEGKWRIAYKFGITVAELHALNPNMNPVLQPGDELNVPNIADNQEKATVDTYNYYEVLPKEGFYRLKVKLGLTQDQLEALNPELKADGLKQGMVLKIPADIDVKAPTLDVETVDLTDNLNNYSTKRIALLMPYCLDRIPTDSVEEAKDMIKTNLLLSAVLDYHAGMQMALDSVKQLGISVDMKVFDTQNRLSKVRQILATNDFSNYDAVIGHMKNESIDLVGSKLKSNNVPVVAPLSKPKNVYANMFQTIPNDALLQKSMINFVKQDSLKNNVIIIADRSHRKKAELLKSEFPSAKVIYSRLNKKTKKDDFFIYELDIQRVLHSGKTVVFLETENNSFASSVISMLNGLSIRNNKIVLVTTDKNKAFNDNIDNVHLSHLQFHYPSVNKQITKENSNNGFIKAYKSTYGVYPNRYAVRGFDITLDVVMRLASADNLYEGSKPDLYSEQLENKFKYNKSLFGGYVNEAVYIVKHKDLHIVKAN
jgi:LysM repeat protein/ABC-type branched-subunit amino acid transport system substrate-binding protein